MTSEQKPWPHPCRACGGNGGHEAGCPGDLASSEAEVERLRTLLRQAAVATGEQLGDWDQLPTVIARKVADVERLRTHYEDIVERAYDAAHADYRDEVERLTQERDDIRAQLASPSAPSGWQPRERQAFEAGFCARPKSRESWVANEINGASREWEFSHGGSAHDLMPEAWQAWQKETQE